MPKTSEADLVKSLEDVLELERNALVQGDLDRLHNTAPEKEKLIGAMNDLDVFDSDELIRLQKKSSGIRRC